MDSYDKRNNDKSRLPWDTLLLDHLIKNQPLASLVKSVEKVGESNFYSYIEFEETPAKVRQPRLLNNDVVGDCSNHMNI